MAREVEDQARADRIRRARGPAPARGQGHPVCAGKVEGREGLFSRAREGDGERRDARQAGVGGVARACPHPVVDVDECAQILQEAIAHGPSVSRARGPGRGYPLCGWLIGARVRSEGDGADRGRAARL